MSTFPRISSLTMDAIAHFRLWRIVPDSMWNMLDREDLKLWTQSNYKFIFCIYSNQRYSFRFIGLVWWQTPRLSTTGFCQDKIIPIDFSYLLLAPLSVFAGRALIWCFNISLISPILGVSLKNFTLLVVTVGLLTGRSASFIITSNTQLLQSWGFIWALPSFSSSLGAKPVQVLSSSICSFDNSWHRWFTWSFITKKERRSDLVNSWNLLYSSLVWSSIIVALMSLTFYYVRFF